MSARRKSPDLRDVLIGLVLFGPLLLFRSVGGVSSLSATTPARRADVRRGPEGSLAVSFFSFFFGAEGFVVDVLFSGLGPMLMEDSPTSLFDVRQALVEFDT